MVTPEERDVLEAENAADINRYRRTAVVDLGDLTDATHRLRRTCKRLTDNDVYDVEVEGRPAALIDASLTQIELQIAALTILIPTPED